MQTIHPFTHVRPELYDYLSKFCWSTALRTLASQADKAIYTNKFINRDCNGFPVQLLFDLFVKLILLNGCEIWGYTVQDEIETVHRTFCKYV